MKSSSLLMRTAMKQPPVAQTEFDEASIACDEHGLGEAARCLREAQKHYNCTVDDMELEHAIAVCHMERYPAAARWLRYIVEVRRMADGWLHSD